MDILDRLVELAQVKGSVDVQCLFRGEWYVRHEPKRAHGLVHIVTAGSGYIRIDGEQEARLLSAGDIIFFPRSVGHTLSSDSSCENFGVRVLTAEMVHLKSSKVMPVGRRLCIFFAHGLNMKRRRI